MSNSPKREQIAKPITARLLGISGDDRKFLIVSVVLHVIVLALLLVSWNFSEPVKMVSLPANIQAHLLDPDELKVLNRKHAAELEKAEDLKKAKELKEKEKKTELERKNVEKKLQEEVKRKEEDARKKALIKKQEEEKKTKEELAKAEQKKKELEKKRLEELEKDKQRQKQEKESLQAERERRLAERMKAIESRENQLDAERLSQAQQNALQQEATEVERFHSMIQQKVSANWSEPPNSKGRRVKVRINLLPTGELSSAVLLESSGNAAFDQSVMVAVNSIRVFPVPQNSGVFENNFRRFVLDFAPD